jgi:predicted dehydrogenase
LPEADFRWGVIGPGRIAHRFAQAVQALPGMRLVAVAGRRAEGARSFAAQWSSPAVEAGAAPVQASDSVAQLLARGDLDAVYVATPHALHGQAVRACLLAGLPVLCEKPLVPTAAEAQALVALARERGLFLMEALWTRFLPLYDEIGHWLRSGRIGALRAVSSSFAFHLPYDAQHRCFNPALAGGALLDIGIYNLALSRWALEHSLGACPPLQQLHCQGLLAPSGVDQRVSAQLVFEGGVVAQLFCAFDSQADNGLHLQGEHGCIVVPHHFWQGTQAQCLQAGQPPLLLDRPFAVNGFEGEVLEAVRCIRAGQVESPRMPHQETLALAQTLDAMRQQLGVRYPFEQG